VFIRGGTRMGVPVAHVCKTEGSWCHVCVHMWGLHGTCMCDLGVLVAHVCKIWGSWCHIRVHMWGPGGTRVYIRGGTHVYMHGGGPGGTCM